MDKSSKTALQVPTETGTESASACKLSNAKTNFKMVLT